MEEKFSYDKYIELLHNARGEFDSTPYTYVEKFIPNMLYKYMSIESVENGKEMREKRLKALREEKIWASHANILNDPFELKIFNYDLDNRYVREFNHEVMKAHEIISLSSSPYDKLMWSHYANSHSGICLEFQFEVRGEPIFPVEYYEISKREDVTSIIENWMKTKQAVLKGTLSTFDVRCIVAEIMRICFRKEKIWNYEQEYRILTRNHEAIDNEEYEKYLCEKGSCHKMEDVGLRLTSIILGLNCSEEDEKDLNELIEIINENRLEAVLSQDKMYDRARMKSVMRDNDEFVKLKRIEIDENDLSLVILEV